MTFKKLSAPTLKELFIVEIETMILSGKLPVGYKLPSERELAKVMDISRSVVNAGIVEMAAKGFLEIVPRVGAYVTDYRLKGTLDILPSIIKHNGGQLRRDDIRSILELRRVLLTFALELAIPKMTIEEVTSLKAKEVELSNAVTGEEASIIIFDFDHMLSGFSENTMLPLIFSSFKEPVMTLWERYFRLYGIEGMCQRVSKLINYIQEKDIEKAVEVVSESVLDTISGSKSIYEE